MASLVCCCRGSRSGGLQPAWERGAVIASIRSSAGLRRFNEVAEVTASARTSARRPTVDRLGRQGRPHPQDQGGCRLVLQRMPQFFPDKPAAPTQMRSALTPGVEACRRHTTARSGNPFVRLPARYHLGPAGIRASSKSCSRCQPMNPPASRAFMTGGRCRAAR
jgi:hypothetical protein